jgi:hypothetical protein
LVVVVLFWRKILITDKCTMALKKWREKLFFEGESFRVDRYSTSNYVRKNQGYENEDRAQAGNVQ